MKPKLTIDVTAPEGNVYALVAKATATLKEAGQPIQARILRDWFKTVPPQGGVSYGDVQRMIEMFCEVKWLNNPLPPNLTDAVPQLLAAMAEAATGGKPYLITYEFTESGITQRCGFICAAENVRAAAENFWGQHPGPWFTLISVNDGGIEAFWQARQGTFVTIPGSEEVGL